MALKKIRATHKWVLLFGSKPTIYEKVASGQKLTWLNLDDPQETIKRFERILIENGLTGTVELKHEPDRTNRPIVYDEHIIVIVMERT